MAKQTAAVEVSSFVKGLVTEASPLTFPDNASLDEVNIVLNKDGSRRRRLGLDYEENHSVFNTGVDPNSDLVINSFVWKQPGGYTEKEFIVIQTGVRISILDSTLKPISANVIGTYDIGNSQSQRMSMASVDGVMVVATGGGNVYSFDYDGNSVSFTTGRLKIRDLFGVADIADGVNLLDGSGIQTRPTTRTDAHIYNLRNQTFAYPRFRGDGLNAEILTCPIYSFFIDTGKYQANSDNLVTYLYANANDGDDRNTRRYFQKDNANNPLGTNRAPLGFFIIDALNRGASRISEIQSLYSQYPQLQYPVTSLPVDTTPGGASVVGAYAGRVWYGGFSSQIIGGDSESPRMTSYVLFSRLVKKPTDIFKCYQEGDPTSSETPDLVDTDGGFLRLDGAYNIQQIINVGEALMVIAENGVWKITGGSGYGFKATDYLTTKITEHGCVSPGSVVVVDNTFMYWSDDGIYHVSQNQYGDWTATNLSSTTIQTLFDKIPYTSKQKCQGNYDSYQRQVRWLYNNYFDSADYPKELILDINLSAFTQTVINPLSNSQFPRPLSIVKVPPFVISSSNVNILDSVGNSIITSASDFVVVTESALQASTSELFYVVADGMSGGILQLTFAYYKNLSFKDWYSKDNNGIDAKGYLLTGWSGGGDYQRQKQIPYITVYSLKTETGFNSEFEPTNPSSIILQGQWSWTNSSVAGKWTNKIQAYRHNRLWFPSSSDEGFDDGEHVVTTRNKLRGRGRVISLLFETEPEKDFHLLGWSYLINVNGTV